MDWTAIILGGAFGLVGYAFMYLLGRISECEREIEDESYQRRELRDKWIEEKDAVRSGLAELGLEKKQAQPSRWVKRDAP